MVQSSVCRFLLLLLTYFVLSIMLRPSVASAADAGAPKNPRHLIICVDGVGFSTIEKLQKENRLRSFNAPAHLLAPFPTLTNIAMTEILRPAGAPNAAGYEDSYYDTEHQRLRGNLLDRFNNRRFIKASFRELFDYHPSAIKSGLGYVAPPLSTYLEVMTDLMRLR